MTNATIHHISGVRKIIENDSLCTCQAQNMSFNNDMKNKIFNLPLRWEYSETGGYDCMSSSYDIIDASDVMVAQIDLREIQPERSPCEYGESKKAELMAEFFVSAANNQ